MVGENCRSGCRTRDHASYAECLRAANTGVNMTVPFNRDPWDRNIDAYRKVRAEGIQPDSSSMRDIEVAKAFSDKEGIAYDAGNKTETLLKAKGYA